MAHLAKRLQDIERSPPITLGGRRRGMLGRLGSRHLREAEKLLEKRVQELTECAAELAEAAAEIERREGQTRELAGEIDRRLRSESAELDARESALDALTRELAAREEALAKREQALEQRRRELGAVELRRASVEQREQALARREQALQPVFRPAQPQDASHVLFVPGSGYSLSEVEGPAPRPGSTLDLGGMSYVVARLGSSPLPADTRPCAYLEAGLRNPDAQAEPQ